MSKRLFFRFHEDTKARRKNNKYILSTFAAINIYTINFEVIKVVEF